MVTLGFLISGVVLFSHIFINNINTLFLFRGLAGWSIGMLPGSIVALAWGNSLGVFSGLGSLGYTLGNFLPGLLKNNFLIFTSASLFCLIGFILSFFLKDKKAKTQIPIFPYELIKRNSAIYLPFFIRHSAAQAIWAIFPVYLSELGASKFQIGLLYAINPFAQFLFMILIENIECEKLIRMGILFSGLTFLGYGFSPNWKTIILFQVLLGFSWASLYLGSIKFLLKNNLEQATASGFLNSVIGLSGIIGPMLGGIIALLGVRVLLFVSAIVSFFAFLIKRRMGEYR